MTATKVAKVEQPAEPDEFTMRDRFAWEAIAGCLSAGRHFDKKELAAEAYELADAMLIARKKESK